MCKIMSFIDKEDNLIILLLAARFTNNTVIKYKYGRWSNDEKKLFILGLKIFGKDFKSIQKLVKSRSLVQIRSHSQKYFKKIYKKNLK